MELRLLSTQPQCVRVVASGRIGQRGLPPDSDPLRQLVGEQAFSKHVLLSLADVISIDSTGLGWLIRCHRRIHHAGGRLVLHSLPPTIQELLRIMRLGQVLAIAANETDAVAMAQAQSAETPAAAERLWDGDSGLRFGL